MQQPGQAVDQGLLIPDNALINVVGDAEPGGGSRTDNGEVPDPMEEVDRVLVWAVCDRLADRTCCRRAGRSCLSCTREAVVRTSPGLHVHVSRLTVVAARGRSVSRCSRRSPCRASPRRSVLQTSGAVQGTWAAICGSGRISSRRGGPVSPPRRRSRVLIAALPCSAAFPSGSGLTRARARPWCDVSRSGRVRGGVVSCHGVCVRPPAWPRIQRRSSSRWVYRSGVDPAPRLRGPVSTHGPTCGSGARAAMSCGACGWGARGHELRGTRAQAGRGVRGWWGSRHGWSCNACVRQRPRIGSWPVGCWSAVGGGGCGCNFRTMLCSSAAPGASSAPGWSSLRPICFVGGSNPRYQSVERVTGPVVWSVGRPSLFVRSSRSRYMEEWRVGRVCRVDGVS